MNWRKHMPERRPAIVLHHLGIDDPTLAELQALVDRLSTELALDLRLALHGGEAVIVDAQVSRIVSPQLLQAFCEERPLLTLKRAPDVGSPSGGAIDYEDLRDQVQALSQRLPAAGTGPDASVAAVVAPRGQSEHREGDSRYDSSFDSRYPGHAEMEAPADASSALFLRALHRGRSDPGQPPLEADYGPGATMVIDFASGRVMLDPVAWSELRLARRLPQLAAGATPAAGMQVRELDLVMWDLGWAAGAHPLLDAPADWWHTPLVPVAVENVARYSGVPLHREMSRVLARGGVTPSQLRRECRASLRELRSFLQACVFLRLVSWRDEAGSAPPAAAGATPGPT